MSATTLAFLVLAASFMLSVTLTPMVRALAVRWGVVDKPGPRKIHRKPIPRMGGMAIFIAWLVPLLAIRAFGDPRWMRLFGEKDIMWGIILSATAMFVLGLYDDIRGAGAGLKLPVEIAAAIGLFALGFRIEQVSNLFGDPFVLGVFALPITVLWIVGLTNAVNLMDGIDGLAAGVAAMTALVMGFAARQHGGDSCILYAVPLVGAAIGFLVYNFPPASIFMGDCGSLFLGFSLATISLLGRQKGHVAVAVFVPLIAFGVPIADTSLAILRRFLTGHNIFEADRRHLHHMLLRTGMSKRRVLLVLYGVTVVFGVAALLLVAGGNRYAPWIVIAVLVGVASACGKLGYYEFGNVRDFLKHGLGLRRKLVFRRGLVESAGQSILGEHSFDRVWETVRAAAAMLEFDKVTFEPSQGSADSRTDTGEAIGASGRPETDKRAAPNAQAGRCIEPERGEKASAFADRLPTDFRRRMWARTHAVENAVLAEQAEIPVRCNGRLYGTLVFEREAAGKSDTGERILLGELCQYVSMRLVELEKQIAMRGNGSNEAHVAATDIGTEKHTPTPHGEHSKCS